MFSEIRLDNFNLRLDAEYYMKEYIDFFKSVSNLYPLGSFVKDGYRVVYENTNIINSGDGRANNYPVFLQATDLLTPFIKTNRLFYVHEKDWVRYQKGHIKRGELLIEVKGKIEKVALVPDDFLEKALVSGSIYKLTINEKINKYFLLAYLICKYGSAFKNRYKTNLLISFLSKDDLYRIPVPVFGFKFQSNIEIIFLELFKLQKESAVNLFQTEAFLSKIIDCESFLPLIETFNVKAFSDSFSKTGRLDAEYYSPAKEEALEVLNKLSDSTVGDLFESIRCLWQPDKGDSVDKVRNYDLSDALNLFLDDLKEPVERTAIASTKKIIQEGDLVVSRLRAYLKEIAVVKASDETLMVASTEFIVLRPKATTTLPVEALLMYLRSELPQLVFKWSQDGSHHPRFDEGELLRLPVPRALIAHGGNFVEAIQAVIASREQANQLLEVAKRAVEIAIEQDEAAGMAYLASESALA